MSSTYDEACGGSNVAGDSMSTGDKASSMLNQAKQTAQGDIDAMKRDDRSKTST
jgi:hypothetical protein